MSDFYSEIAGVSNFQKPVCRVAYTLNNTQPVLCTIIDDHPLFYLDVDAEYEDEELLDAADLGILEQEIASLNKSHALSGTSSAVSEISTQEKLDLFSEDASFITQSTTSEDSDIQALIETLEQSRLTKAYLESMREHKVEMIFSEQVRTAMYNRHAETIAINPNVNRAEQLLLAIRELRRHFQHRQGALIHPLMFNPDNAVLINRVQVADLVTSMVRGAWELQLSGEKAAWEHLETSTMDDLARAFAREAFLDFRTINNGQAAAAIFEAWFLSERPRAEDKKLINQMLADQKGFVFDLEEAEAQITPQLIAALGKMPFGKNYLAEHAVTIMDDAIFTDVRDRSNANFLWFIKFERSFRETEHELQGSDDLAADASPAFAKPQNKDLSDGPSPQNAEHSAEVIRLYDDAKSNGDKPAKDGKRLSPSSRSKRTNNEDGSNVVYLRRWSGE